MLQMIVVGLPGRSLRLPTRIRSVCVDPTLHEERVKDYTDSQKGTGCVPCKESLNSLIECC